MVKKTCIYHFPVGNGDMTLIKIASNDKYYYVLVDMHIRDNCRNADDKCDVLSELHNILETDNEGRPYIDVLVLTHPDKDHIGGFKEYFHQGEPESYTTPKDEDKGKIFVREIWSSPMIFRRKKKNESLCSDAKIFKTEAKRRVNLYRDTNSIGAEGDRIRIIGEDIDGKTNDIMPIVYKLGDKISKVNDNVIKELTVNLLGPLSDEDFDDNEKIDKNRSSIIMQWCIASHGYTEPTNFILLAGDASVETWEILYAKYKKDSSKLKYDILIAPHHCSWHTLSHDSYSESDNPLVSNNAISALSHARTGAMIISSSNEIEDDENDPPNHQAKLEYEKIAKQNDGSFICLADNIASEGQPPAVLALRLTREGPQKLEAKPARKPSEKIMKRTDATSSLFAHSGQAIGHG